MRFRASGLDGRARPVSSWPAEALFLVCTAAVVLAGCGSSGNKNKASSASSGSTASTKPAAITAAMGLRDRLLSWGEFAGFTRGGVTVYTTTRQWLSDPNDQQSAAQTAAEKAMLTREGFRGGGIEQLTAAGTADQGLSIVEQFRSVNAARGALAYYVSAQKNPNVQASDGTYASFKVSGIPGAIGYSLGGASGGINIAFAYGDDYYLVGREGGSRRDIAGLNAAARHLYQRMRG